jgi:peroxiredoxin Q/BCP
LAADDGTQVTLSALQGRNVILYAYPAAFTSGCTIEAGDFRDAYSAITAAGYEVLGISPDDVPKLASFVADLKLPFRLLSDTDHKVLEEYGAWGERTIWGRTSTGVIRSTFVIDKDGQIALADYEVKAPGHVERLTKQLGIDWEQ